MVSGSRADGGASGIPSKDRKTVMSIKEIARNHSESEIYAVLKESNMDPDETAQKLLNQDPFHEVRKRRDKKKENTGHRNSNESRKLVNVAPWTNNQVSSDWNSRKGPYTRSTPGISHEFRVVRDNRVNQIPNGDAKQGTSHIIVSSNEQAQTKLIERSSESRSDQKRPVVSQSDRRSQAFGIKSTAPDIGHARGSHSADAGNHWPEVRNATMSKNNVESQEVENIPSTPTSSRSAFGVYSSSSDPVHVPSDSRSAGTVGAIKREVGVVGKRTASQPSVSCNSLPTPVRRDVSISTESSGQSVAVPKSTSLQQPSMSDRVITGNSVVRTFAGNQHANKQNPQSAGHQKGTQSTMEWKPKSIRKPSSIGTGVNGQVLTDGSTHNGITTQTNVEGTLSDKLSEVNIHENKHVIIPKHLRVPEVDRVHVTFGSFGVASDSSNDAATVLTSSKNLEDSVNESVSMMASTPEGSNGDASVEDRVELVEDQSMNYRSESPASPSPSHCGKPTLENVDSRTMENYEDIGLVQSHGRSQTPPEPRDMQNSPNLPTLSEAYDIQQSYEVPFLRETIEDNIQTQGLGSLPEVSSNVANSSPPASVPVLTHQPPLSQHQPVTPLYPQLQFSHFPNYLPYHRQILSPMFVPPMAMPTNYTTNPAYPHPSNGSSYLLMPGGSSHLTAGGMKFAAPQFKSAAAGNPTAYGNYTSPAGYAISSPGAVGSAAGLEDINRIKYKDNNLYLQNPQAETSELWVQNPRDIAGLQSPHYYNVPGQAPHAAYLPTHAGHAASFNAAVQPSHIQFPGLYHPPQPAAIANPHHLVHQQVPPSIGGNAGVGMSAPGPQVGSYQQSQLGHLNWSSSF